MRFLILTWGTRVPRVSDILLSSTRNTHFGSSARYEPCQTTDFFTFYFRWREEGATSVLGSQPIIWLLSPSPFRFQVTRVRLPSTNIWSLLCDLHSFLTVTLWRLDTVNSNTRSSNFISLLPVGYHVTIFFKITLFFHIIIRPFFKFLPPFLSIYILNFHSYSLLFRLYVNYVLINRYNNLHMVYIYVT